MTRNPEEAQPDVQARRDEAARAGRRKLERWARERSRPEYFRFRIDLVAQIRSDKLRPFEVAAILEREAGRFHEISVEEIEAYRAMGDAWHAWTGSPAEVSAAQGTMW